MDGAQRQVAVVIDLNKCMGCQTCTVACKMAWANDTGMDHQWWMTVGTVPGRGYPKDWERMGGGYDAHGAPRQGERPTMEAYGAVMEFDYAKVFYGGAAAGTSLTPRGEVSWGPNWEEDIATGDFPNAHYFYLPRLCNHCARPACAEACPLGAIRKRAGDGMVTIDEGACERCQDPLCMRACPYKVIYWNDVRQAAQKCHGCAARMEQGVAPACVRQCPGRCMWVDYLDNRAGTVHQLVKEWQVALPLHPEFGVGPNVYYVPPFGPPRFDAGGDLDESAPRIPLDYLRSLFGPGVEEALHTLGEEHAKRARRPKEPSALMDLLVARRWQALLGGFGREPSEVSVP